MRSMVNGVGSRVRSHRGRREGSRTVHRPLLFLWIFGINTFILQSPTPCFNYTLLALDIHSFEQQWMHIIFLSILMSKPNKDKRTAVADICHNF
jgi:hypothetical protein